MSLLTFKPREVPTLRPYQSQAVDDLRAAMRAGSRRPLLTMPTGAGKAVVLAEVARMATARGQRTLVLAHRKELIQQLSEKVLAVGVDHGIILPGEEDRGHLPVQVGSVQTMGRRLHRYGDFGMIIIDEAHHSTATTYRAIINHWPNAFLLGLTATPERLDGKGLDEIYDHLVCGPTMKQLIKLGALCPYEAFSGKEADLSGVRTQMGDYNQKQLGGAVSKATIVGDIVKSWTKHAAGLQTMAFGVTVEHAEMIAYSFTKAGIAAAALSGESHKDERREVMSAFKAGRIQVLASCELFGEGIDVPAVGAVILGRPTQSLAIYLQQVGRGLRPAPGKQKLVILDHAGNCRRHGLPDKRRLWTLEGRDIQTKMTERFCAACNDKVEVARGEQKCPDCGTPFPVTKKEEGNKRQIEVVGGDLELLLDDAPDTGPGFSWDRPKDMSDEGWLTAMRVARFKKVPPICSLSFLEEMARQRGFKAGWAWHTHRQLKGIVPFDPSWRPQRFG